MAIDDLSAIGLPCPTLWRIPQILARTLPELNPLFCSLFYVLHRRCSLSPAIPNLQLVLSGVFVVSVRLTNFRGVRSDTNCCSELCRSAITDPSTFPSPFLLPVVSFGDALLTTYMLNWRYTITILYRRRCLVVIALLYWFCYLPLLPAFAFVFPLAASLYVASGYYRYMLLFTYSR